MAVAPQTDGIEEDFRQLMAIFEAEQAKCLGNEQRLARERTAAMAEVDFLRKDTQDWCLKEKRNIEAEWRRLDQLAEKMNRFWPSKSAEVKDINCYGQIFSVPLSLLSSVKGSDFSKLFEEDSQAAKETPRDPCGRLMLDFNPECVRIVIDHLHNRRLNINAPLPAVPGDLRESLELVAGAWGLDPFVLGNRLNPLHNTSLRISGAVARATHKGWQLISAQHALPVAISSYFEARIMENPDPNGGLAVGVCGHPLAGGEVHSLRPVGSVLYNSGNGLVGDCINGTEDVTGGIQLLAGSSFGIRFDVERHTLEWFHDGDSLGMCTLQPEWLERMTSLYPVFGLFVPGQAIEVDFHTSDMEARARKAGKAVEAAAAAEAAVRAQEEAAARLLIEAEEMARAEAESRTAWEFAARAAADARARVADARARAEEAARKEMEAEALRAAEAAAVQAARQKAESQAMHAARTQAAADREAKAQADAARAARCAERTRSGQADEVFGQTSMTSLSSIWETGGETPMNSPPAAAAAGAHRQNSNWFESGEAPRAHQGSRPATQASKLSGTLNSKNSNDWLEGGETPRAEGAASQAASKSATYKSEGSESRDWDAGGETPR